MMQYEREKNYIRKENAYEILKAFAKEYRKQNGESIPVEIIIVGGGSILLNYGFRDFTQDFDVMVSSMSEMKEVVHRVAEEYNLPDDWMNTDFRNAISYSEKLRTVSKHKYEFNHGSLEIRTVNDEYLIAMKMMSARGYRNDVSDIVGIILSARKDNKNITTEQIENALSFLYPDYKNHIREELLHQVDLYTKMTSEDLSAAYRKLKDEEGQTRKDLIEIDEKYPGAVNEKSVDSIIAEINKRRRGK